MDEDLKNFRRPSEFINEERKKSSRKKGNKENKLITFLAARPKWMWIMITTILASVTVGASVALGMSTLYNPALATTNYTLNSTIGKTCVDSGYCIANAYCSISVGASFGVCTCVTTYYLDTTSATCIPRNTYAQSCSFDYNCLQYKRLICTSGTCQCPTTMYWNSTASECQFLKVANSICINAWSSLEVIANAICWPNPNSLPSHKVMCGTCCGTYYWWWYNPTTGSCQYKSVVGTACTSDRQCIDYAYCTYTSSSPTQKVCVCDPGFYTTTSQQCTMKGSYGSGCGTVIDQCNLNQMNLRCFSGTCNCNTKTEYWDTYYLKCLPLRTYGQTCGVGSLSSYNCISGLSCLYPNAGGSRKVCQCSSSTYFDWASGTCLTLKTYNSICYSRFECSTQASMQCLATNGGSTKRCLCAPNYAYVSSTSTCSLSKAYGVSCGTTYTECQSYYGMYCSTSTWTCQCNSGLYYDSALQKCIPARRRYDYCSSSSQCASNWCWGNYCQ